MLRNQRQWIGLLLGFCVLGGCEASVAGVHDEPEPCAKWQKLADVVGCTPTASCQKLAARCEAEAAEMIDCAADNRVFCYCEHDDDMLNCEGTWKPSEGSGRCKSAYKAFQKCNDDANDDADE